MRLRRGVASLSTLAAFWIASAAAAQGSDSALFHRGQWGVNFLIGSGFASAGALHFRSPTRATLLDLSGDYSHTSNTAATPALRTSNANATLSLGTRAYHRVDPHIWRWTTLGVSFVYNRQSVTQGSLAGTVRGVGAGVFGNLGGTWLVTPHLGLGAQWQGDLTYTHNGASGPLIGSGTTDNVTIDLARVALTGQLYF